MKPDVWLANAWLELTPHLKHTSLRLEEPLWRSPGRMPICLKQLFVVRELFRYDWNTQPCVLQIRKKNITYCKRSIKSITITWFNIKDIIAELENMDSSAFRKKSISAFQMRIKMMFYVRKERPPCRSSRQKTICWLKLAALPGHSGDYGNERHLVTWKN